MKSTKAKFTIGILLIFFGFAFVIPAIIGLCLIFQASKEKRRRIAAAKAKIKSILNVAHPCKFLISEDHAMLSSHPSCPVCSLYNLRIFSISGKDKRFPPLASLPDTMHDGKCDVCNCCYSLLTWFEGISTPDIVTAIQKSNAPLVDRRTPEQKEHFEKKQAQAARKKIKELKEGRS
jgi:hypothetical protein